METRATELYRELREAGCGVLPARPKELSQEIKALADRSSTLRASFGWRGKDKVIRLELERSVFENSVCRAGSVGESSIIAASANATNATYASSEVETLESVRLNEQYEGTVSTERERVRKVLETPPNWLRDTNLAGYQEGRWDAKLVSVGVASALGMTPHEDGPRIQPLVEAALKELGIEQG